MNSNTKITLEVTLRDTLNIFHVYKEYIVWTWTHDEYDGPGDNRNGAEFTFEKCMESLWEYIEDEQD